MSEWAPIVHGRTLYVDYRPNLIVVPEGFTEREIEWAQKYIFATTRSLEFSERPLWSVFTGERYGIVGVTCWASDVPDVSSDMTHEELGRRLYVFLGYVAPLPLPGLPPADLAVFAPLYEFVEKRWLERDYNSRDLHTYPFTLDPPLIETGESTAKLNLDLPQAAVWPVSEDEHLWRAAGREGTVSLCLGLTRSQEVLKSPFLNATAQDADQFRVMLRPEERRVAQQPMAPAAPRPEERRPPRPEERERRHDPDTGRSPVAPGVGLIGLLLMLLIGLRELSESTNARRVTLIGLFLMLLIGALRFFFPSSKESPPQQRFRPRNVPPGFRPASPDSPPRSASSEPVRRSGLPPGFRRPAGSNAGERKRDEEPWDDWN